ncbi:hypothetical protein [Undibacterium sp. TC9W]|uniref:hypothetical protein n=1 Tax=Undibacterium sp. TC9W TaxID=3413053 RepID=UPI003BF23E9B
MPDKQSKNVLKFPQKIIPNEENKLLAILKATQEKIGELKPTGTNEITAVAPPATVINNINIHGGNNQLAPGHLAVSMTESQATNALKHAQSETYTDAINAAQKVQLRKLRDEIVKLSSDCGFPKHPAAIMSALNTTMGVRKYDQIVASEFPIAKAYLTTMKSVFTERLDFHRKKEELRRYMIQVITETHRKVQPIGASSMLGLLDGTPFSDLEKMYDLAITDLI